MLSKNLVLVLQVTLVGVISMDFDLAIRKLSVGMKKGRPPFRLPLNSGHVKGQSIELSKLQIYQWADALFSVGKSIDLLTFTQKKYLIQCLDWAAQFQQPATVPIYCFALRSFLETTAHFASSCQQIIDEYDKYTELLTSAEMCLDSFHDDKINQWSNYLKEHFYNKIMTNFVPTTIAVPTLEYPANPSEQLIFKDNMGEFRDEDLSILTGNPSVSIGKEHILKPQNIISKLQKLEKLVDGVRPTYEYLSEFVHPNSFPAENYSQLLTTANGEAYYHYINQTDTPLHQISKRLDRVPLTVSQCVNVIIHYEKAVLEIKKGLDHDIKRVARPTLKQHHLIPPDRLNDSCICGSTKILKKCCAKSR